MGYLLSYQGNAGDSRGVLGIKGRAKPMSFDHKPQNDSKFLFLFLLDITF